MRKEKSKSDLVKCPFCHGRGKLLKSELLHHLRDKDLLPKVESPAAPAASDVDTLPPHKLESKRPQQPQETELLNLTHFLWRRPPKD